jgi:serine phosphatase RsbU (regulator of sigma subunit)
MRRGLSIGNRLSLAFGAGVFIAAIVSALAVWAVWRTRASTELALQRVATVARLSSGLRSMQIAEDAYMTTGDPGDLARFRAQWDATDRDGTALQALVDDASTRATVGELLWLSRDFRAQVEAQARALSGEAVTDDPSALQQIVRRKTLIASQLNSISANLVDAEVARTAPQLLGSFNRVLVLFGLVAASMFFGFALTSWIGRGIVSGLGGIIAEIHAMSASSRFDRRLSTRWNEDPSDEIGQLARAFNAMATIVGARQERLEGEMELARRIQTSILPRDLDVDGLEIAVRMLPATEVGGDYYDVRPIPGGCWFGIGDVAGHGLDAGLIMLMVQSSVAGVARDDPDATPSQVLAKVNEVVFDNVHERLGKHEHATLTLVRYHADGRIVFAGAHEEIILVRKRDGRAECLASSGPWVGLVPRIEGRVTDAERTLEDGDLMVLYTDGVTEAADASGRAFGTERLCAELERVCEDPVERIRDHVFDEVARWMHEQRDDVTVLVARYRRTRAG